MQLLKAQISTIIISSSFPTIKKNLKNQSLFFNDFLYLLYDFS